MQSITGLEQWQDDLRAVARPEKVAILSSFFKTKPGEYGYGDKFIGVTVPDNRRIARRYALTVPMQAISWMCRHEIHEFRLSGFLALVAMYQKAKTDEQRSGIVAFYLDHAGWANNWDLVDLSAPYILGAHLVSVPDGALLDRLSIDADLWRQRIAIVSTMMLIRAGRFDDTLRISRRYLTHPHQLIHKATGWMLREIGKRDEAVLLQFLDENASAMPRTALRYAIERLTPEQRKHYMQIKQQK